MSKKKSVLLVLIAFVLGAAIGVGATLGIRGNYSATVVGASEALAQSDEYAYSFLDETLGTVSKCTEYKMWEVLKSGDTVSQQRLVSTKWTITIDGIDEDGELELVPFIVNTENGKKIMEQYPWYKSTVTGNQLKTVITLIPTDMAFSYFTTPGEVDADLHLFFKVSDNWITDDGLVMVSDMEAFLSGNYTGVIFYGTEEEMKSSDYSFLNDAALLITYRDAAQRSSDLSTAE